MTVTGGRGSVASADDRGALKRTFRSMLISGSPAVLASALMMMIPVAGKFYLDADSYALWALAATVVTISLVLDFGAGAWATSVFALRSAQSSINLLVRPVLVTTAGCLLVGLTFTVLWHWYSGIAGIGAGGAEGYVLMSAAGIAAGFRAGFAVVCSACLGCGLNTIRGVSLLIQAVLSLVFTIVLLQMGLGVFSYVVAVALSSVVTVIVAVHRLRKALTSRAQGGSEDRDSGSVLNYSLRSFAASRGAVTILGLTLTQLDRWVVGLVGHGAALSSYDIAVRIASAPRLLAISLSTVLIADAVRQRSDGARIRGLLRRSQLILAATLAAATIAIGGAVVVLERTSAGSQMLAGVPLVMLTAMFAWYGLNGLTASLSLISIGLGRPQFELIYLAPVVIATAAFWAWAVVADSASVAIYGAGGALMAGSVVFLLIGPRLLVGQKGIRV